MPDNREDTEVSGHPEGAQEQNANASVPGSPDAVRRATVARLNDALRCRGEGGRVVVTAGVAALPPITQAALLVAVAAFDSFDPEDDPYGEHDFGTVDLGGRRFFWKVDYLNLDQGDHAPDPADPEVTCRVLTIMRAEEY